MQKASIAKNGFVFRAMICPHCNEKLIHPLDEEKYNKFKDLKNKQFSVKMRLVGNSYAVSIPMEIVSFMREQEKIMNDMVRLCFEDFGRLSLNFNTENIGFLSHKLQKIPRVHDEEKIKEKLNDNLKIKESLKKQNGQ